MSSFSPLSAFDNFPSPPVDEQLALKRLHDVDPCDQKVDLTTEEYKDRNGEPWVLPVVRQTELELIMDSSLSNNIPSMRDQQSFVKVAQDVLFGEASSELRPQLASIQTASGTEACQIGARLLCEFLKPSAIWVPECTGSRHAILDLAGSIQPRTYPYSLPDRSGIDFDHMLAVLNTQARRHDLILLYPCAHSSSGFDMTPEQWTKLGELCHEKNLFPFFDSAYQGFASGDPHADAWPVRHFVQLGLEVCVAQSFTSNFGLYGERVGCLHIALASSGHREAVLDKLYSHQRGSPPKYGAVIVSTILSSEDLYRAWRVDLQSMTDRVAKLRIGLHNELIKRRVPGKWGYLLLQKGMFAHTTLSKQHVELLRKEYHIYIMSTGRISLPGLTAQSIDWVTDAIKDVVTRLPLEEKVKL